LQDRVSRALGRDFLSGVATSLLLHDSIDLWHGTRGQALLDGWQDASINDDTSKNVLGIRPGLAMPIEQLDGGIHPKPAVFFNTTDTVAGRGAWFSNTAAPKGGGTYGVFDDQGAAVSAPVSVGIAVLNSARFPFVSPAGRFDIGGDVKTFLDGGYVDNSGATTLLNWITQKSPAQLVVLNIDGNPQHGTCGKATESKSTLGIEAKTLDVVRSGNADAAVTRVKNIAGREGGPVRVEDVTYSFEDTLEHSFKSHEALCQTLKLYRVAPLGWFMSKRSVSDMALPISNRVSDICTQANLDCGAVK